MTISDRFSRRVGGFLDPIRMAKAIGLYPCLEAVEGMAGPRVEYKGREYLMFGSNDYLGLAQDPRVKEAAIRAIGRFGTGRGGAPLICGYTTLHTQLEERLSEFFKREACVLFASGYHANVGCVSALTRKADSLICDADCHASIRDGSAMSNAHVAFFRHNDVEALSAVLDDVDSVHKVVIVGGVYSMQGDLAPLPEMIEITSQADAFLIVDDAHGLGVIGRNGRGTPEHFDCEDSVDLLVGTMSKSLATTGGFAVGDENVIEYIRHQARSGIFSASSTPANVAAALAALQIVEAEPQRRDHLLTMSRMLRDGLQDASHIVLGHGSAIVSIHIGDMWRTLKASKVLFESGLITIPVIPPGVPAGHELIRMHVTAAHTEEDIATALNVFEQCADAFETDTASQESVASEKHHHDEVVECTGQQASR